MVLKNQNIAPPYISSNFALVTEVGLLIIIPSFSESFVSEVAQHGAEAHNLFDRKKYTAVGYN